ncbi:LOW QUALITY PROTEIN: myomegalin [Tachyglossus aculeatus]|uniref:LOW QUALITY PROTEIN: myomegalin n=1 Tax=Tachyglossus aculeatus TaxID=9261 RepID=UPI0018F72DB9|nr:LOW QUALITY PROTEIN: myomegalin [Tachyglossus aculeatus]
MSNGYRTLSQHLNDLKKENFSLKLRIYFLEEQLQRKYEAGQEDVYRRNISLRVEVESLKQELQEKQQGRDPTWGPAEPEAGQDEPGRCQQEEDRGQEEERECQLDSKGQILQEAKRARSEAKSPEPEAEGDVDLTDGLEETTGAVMPSTWILPTICHPALTRDRRVAELSQGLAAREEQVQRLQLELEEPKGMEVQGSAHAPSPGGGRADYNSQRPPGPAAGGAILKSEPRLEGRGCCGGVVSIRVGGGARRLPPAPLGPGASLPTGQHAGARLTLDGEQRCATRGVVDVSGLVRGRSCRVDIRVPGWRARTGVPARGANIEVPAPIGKVDVAVKYQSAERTLRHQAGTRPSRSFAGERPVRQPGEPRVGSRPVSPRPSARPRGGTVGIGMKECCRICARELCGNQRRWIFHTASKLNLQVLLSHVLGRELSRDGRAEFACSKCAFMLDRVYRFDTVIARVEALSIERVQKLLLEKDRLKACIAGLYRRNNEEPEARGTVGTVDISGLPDARYTALLREDFAYSGYECWAEHEDQLPETHSCQAAAEGSGTRPRRCRGCAVLRVADSDYEAICKVPRKVARSVSCGASSRWSASTCTEEPAEAGPADWPSAQGPADGESMEEGTPGSSLESLEDPPGASPPRHKDGEADRGGPEFPKWDCGPEGTVGLEELGVQPACGHRLELALSLIRSCNYKPVHSPSGSKLPIPVKISPPGTMAGQLEPDGASPGFTGRPASKSPSRPGLGFPLDLSDLLELWEELWEEYLPLHIQSVAEEHPLLQDLSLSTVTKVPTSRAEDAGPLLAELEQKIQQTEATNEVLQQKLRDVSSKLESVLEVSRRQERMIQSLEEALKSRESEVEELHHVIEGQNEAVAKLQGPLDRSQLGQLQVTETSTPAQLRAALLELQNALVYSQLEIQTLQRAARRGERQLAEAGRRGQLAEAEAREGQQQQEATRKHNQELHGILQRLRGELQQKSQQLRALESEKGSEIRTRDQSIQHLTLSLRQKEQLLQEYRELQQLQRRQCNGEGAPEARDLLTEKLRQRILDRDVALERAVDEKFTAVEEKERELGQLRLALRERDRDVERLCGVLSTNEATMQSLESLLQAKGLETEQLSTCCQSLQWLRSEGEAAFGRWREEQAALVQQLQTSLHQCSQELEDLGARLLHELGASLPAEELFLRLQWKEKLLQDVLADRTKQAAEHGAELQALLQAAGTREQESQAVAKRMVQALVERSAEVQALRQHLGRKERGLAHLPGQSQATVATPIELGDTQPPSPGGTVPAPGDPSGGSRAGTALESGVQPGATETASELEKELVTAREELGLLARKERESRRELSTLQAVVAQQEAALQAQAADVETLTRSVQIKEDFIKDLQVQLVDPEEMPAVERLSQEVLLLREKVALAQAPESGATGRQREQLLQALDELLEERRRLNEALEAERQLYSSLVRAHAQPDGLERSLQAELAGAQALRGQLEEALGRSVERLCALETLATIGGPGGEDREDTSTEFTDSIEEEAAAAATASADSVQRPHVRGASEQSPGSLAPALPSVEGDQQAELLRVSTEAQQHLEQRQKVEEELRDLKAQIQEAGFCSVTHIRNTLLSLCLENAELKERMGSTATEVAWENEEGREKKEAAKGPKAAGSSPDPRAEVAKLCGELRNGDAIIRLLLNCEAGQGLFDPRVIVCLAKEVDRLKAEAARAPRKGLEEGGDAGPRPHLDTPTQEGFGERWGAGGARAWSRPHREPPCRGCRCPPHRGLCPWGKCQLPPSQGPLASLQAASTCPSGLSWHCRPCPTPLPSGLSRPLPPFLPPTVDRSLDLPQDPTSDPTPKVQARGPPAGARWGPGAGEEPGPGLRLRGRGLLPASRNPSFPQGEPAPPGPAQQLRARLAQWERRYQQLQDKLVASEATVRAQASQLARCGALMREPSVKQHSKQVQVDLQDLGYETCGRSENEAEREGTTSPECEENDVFSDARLAELLAAPSLLPSPPKRPPEALPEEEEKEEKATVLLQRPVQPPKAARPQTAGPLTQGLQRRGRSCSATSDYASSLDRPRNIKMPGGTDEEEEEEEEEEPGWMSDGAGTFCPPGVRSRADLERLVRRVSLLETRLTRPQPAEESRSAAWAGKYDSLIQAQARELSLLRQKAREARGLGHLLAQHLAGAVKAFEDLLRSADIDYFLGRSFRDQLIRGRQLAERLASKLSPRGSSPLDDPPGRDFLAPSRLQEELQEKERVIEALQAKLDARSLTPSSCRSLSDSQRSPSVASFVSDELDACSDGDAASEDGRREEHRTDRTDRTRPDAPGSSGVVLSARPPSPSGTPKAAMGSRATAVPAPRDLCHHGIQAPAGTTHRRGHGDSSGDARRGVPAGPPPPRGAPSPALPGGWGPPKVCVAEAQQELQRLQKQLGEGAAVASLRPRQPRPSGVPAAQLPAPRQGNNWGATGGGGPAPRPTCLGFPGDPLSFCVPGPEPASAQARENRVLREENQRLQAQLDNLSREHAERLEALQGALRASEARRQEAAERERERERRRDEQWRLLADAQDKQREVLQLRQDRLALRDKPGRLQWQWEPVQAEVQVFESLSGGSSRALPACSEEGAPGTPLSRDLSGLVAEVRALRSQLEHSIQVNDSLRQQLEQQLDGNFSKIHLGPSSPVQAFPATDPERPAQLFPDTILSPPVRDVGMNSPAPTFPGSDAEAPSLEPCSRMAVSGPGPDAGRARKEDPVLVGDCAPGTCASLQSCHVVGHVDHFGALQQQLLEGQGLVQGMVRLLQPSARGPGGEALGLESLDGASFRQLWGSTATLGQILAEATSLLATFWTVAATLSGPLSPAQGPQAEESAGGEIWELRAKVSEQESRLRTAAQRLHSCQQAKQSLERLVVSQLTQTHDVLKKARSNLEKDPHKIFPGKSPPSSSPGATPPSPMTAVFQELGAKWSPQRCLRQREDWAWPCLTPMPNF